MFGRFGIDEGAINRRRHARAPLNSKVIVASLLSDGLKFVSDNNPKVYYIRDISSSGLFIESINLCKIGTTLKLLFPITGTDKIIQAMGKVVRLVEPVIEDEYVAPGMGIEFSNMPFENSVLIENYIINIKYVYDELLLLVTMKNPDVDRIMHLVKKANLGEYKDFFDLKEKIKKVSFSLGILQVLQDGLNLS